MFYEFSSTRLVSRVKFLRRLVVKVRLHSVPSEVVEALGLWIGLQSEFIREFDLFFSLRSLFHCDIEKEVYPPNP